MNPDGPLRATRVPTLAAEPARVLVAAAGSHGDVLPMVALGREFARRGREVFFYANPVFACHAADAGLRFVPVSDREAYATLFADAVDGNPNRAFARVAREFEVIGPRYFEAMRRDVLPRRTMVAGSTLLFAPRLIAETTGAPCATLHLAPAAIRSNDAPPRLLPRWIDASTPPMIKRLAWWLAYLGYARTIGRPLNRQRVALGLPPVQRAMRSWIHEADCVIGLFPDWFAPRQPDWPESIDLAGFPLDDAAEAGGLQRMAGDEAMRRAAAGRRPGAAAGMPWSWPPTPWNDAGAG